MSVTYGDAIFVCIDCGGPAFRYAATLRCSDDACRIVRILQAKKEVFPWEASIASNDPARKFIGTKGRPFMRYFGAVATGPIGYISLAVMWSNSCALLSH